MIHRANLLADLKRVLQRLEADLLQRSESAEVPEVGTSLRAEYDRARSAERTAQNYEDWRTDAITQAAAAWVLSCVFVRFLEDNQLIDPPKIAGPGERLVRARDEWELYLSQAKQPNERDYLLGVFDQLARLPGTRDVFGEHNPIRELPNWLSGDAAKELLDFFQKTDADTDTLVHDFTDPNWDTRFLGDLYQDLSEAARKKYALLQTPEFVEEFILDRTLNPALDEFGLVPGGPLSAAGDQPQEQAAGSYFKMIDPACGSGHFLLGAFPRILDRWQRREPGTNVRELVQRTLDNVHGVDVNPFAIAIARFRLLLAAMRACGVERLAGAPAFRLNLACGDSLLHAPLAAGGNKYHAGQQELDFTLVSDPADECDHAYRSENLPDLKRILRGGQYHAVVANPPYIVPKDRQLNERYRCRFLSCHMKYSLSVPFLERIFRLAVAGGYTGQITANSFMKREFGKKLIESFFPTVDLTHVIDTSGAYIPGHGTPTVILFGRQRGPVSSTLRTVMGIRGEPLTPADPARGLVWSAIVETVDSPQPAAAIASGAATVRERSVSTPEDEDTATLRARLQKHREFVSVADSSRELFHKHPWSIGGGGASELKKLLEDGAKQRLNAIIDSTGFMAITGEDEVFVMPRSQLNRYRLPARPFCVGDVVRDWTIDTDEVALVPYDYGRADLPAFASATLPELPLYLWAHRSVVKARSMFGKSVEAHGFRWFEYMQFIRDRARSPYLIAFGEVATHNHFVLDRGGKVFKQTAPVIKLSADATEDDHLALLGLLNSSTACFWMKQVCHNKGAGGGTRVEAGKSTMGDDMWECHFAFNGTKLQQFPLPLPDGRGSTAQRGAKAEEGARDLEPRPLESGVLRLARQLDELAQLRQRSSPTNVLRTHAPSREALSSAYATFDETRRQMIAAQEELDWECYRLNRLIVDDLTLAKRAARECEAPAEPLSAMNNGRSIDGSAGASPSPLPPLELGKRAFEIVLARKMAAEETRTTWFERHGSTPTTELPAEWPDDYRQLVQLRIDLIESDPNIRLIEQPEYKRRWNTEPWDAQLERALREWLLDRLESYFDFDGRMNEAGRPTAKLDIALVSVATLADIARQATEFQQVGELYRSDAAFDVQALVGELVAAEPQMTLLKDLIDIPEHINKGQIVLRLTKGVTDPQATVATSVPTQHSSGHR